MKSIALHFVALFACIFSCVYVSAQTIETNSVWRQHQNSATVSTVAKPKAAQQTNQTPKAVTGLYNFSGGNGTASDPFRIATAQDLIDLSNAVNEEEVYNTNQPYNIAYYKQIADIDMPENIQGPFIKVKMKVTADPGLGGGEQDAYFVEKILQATYDPNTDSYSCRPYIYDRRLTISVGKTTPDTGHDETKSVWEGFGGGFTNTYNFFYTYEYYDAEFLPFSAIFQPIGTYAAYTYTVTGSTFTRELTAISKPFAGQYDGDNHIISNYTNVVACDYTGLFGYLNHNSGNPAIIKNVNMVNANITNPDNGCTGGIVGIVQYGKVLNCSVTNSTIKGKNVGSIVGYIGSDDVSLLGAAFNLWGNKMGTSVGYVDGCYASNNTLIGSITAGGVVGNTADKKGLPVVGSGRYYNQLDNITNNQAYDNSITETTNGNNKGVIVYGADSQPNATTGAPDRNGNRAYIVRNSTEDIMNDKVPDFCYINNGNSLDPANSIEKRMLDKLEAELNGTQPITQNLVLPDITYMTTAISSNAASILARDLANTPRWSSSSLETPQGTSGTDYYLDAKTAFNQNRYQYNKPEYDSNPNDDKFTANTDSYYDLRSESAHPLLYKAANGKYYYYYYDIDNTSILHSSYYVKTCYFTDIEFGAPNASTLIQQSNHQFTKVYLTWNGYPATVQSDLTNQLSQKTLSLSKYYQLTATSPVTVNVGLGGGVVDNGNQFNGKQIKLKTRLNLKQWNLVGITDIENMGNGFAGEPMDKKVNYLSVTEENNDFAAIDYDYAQNSWANTFSHPYLSASADLTYGQGIFVWPYDTKHPLTGTGNDTVWDYTTTTIKNPVLLQTGTLKAYSDKATLDNTIKTYTTALKNNGNAVNSARWFALANPFTANMTAANILTSLGTVQGACIYTYDLNNGNATWVAKKGNEIITAGQGFMVGITGTQMTNYISSNNLVGINYKPIVAPSSKSAKTSPEESYFSFSTYDHTRMGLSQMTAKVSENASDEFDGNDAFALLSSAERHNAEAFFMVDDKNIWHNQFKNLPHDYLIGFSSQVESDVDFSVSAYQKDIDAYLIDVENNAVIAKLTPTFDTITADSIVYTSGEKVQLHLEQGLNLYKYAVRFCKAGSNVALPSNPQTQQANISIWNNNREISINGKDLKKVEVYNALGQKVYEDQISGNSHTFNLNTIQGAYIIKAYDQNKLSKTAKITIAK
mgnify:FL=1